MELSPNMTCQGGLSVRGQGKGEPGWPCFCILIPALIFFTPKNFFPDAADPIRADMMRKIVPDSGTSAGVNAIAIVGTIIMVPGNNKKM